jgi:hypothetical protein
VVLLSFTTARKELADGLFVRLRRQSFDHHFQIIAATSSSATPTFIA